MIKKAIAVLSAVVAAVVSLGCSPYVGEHMSTANGGCKAEISADGQVADRARVILLAGEENCLGYSYAYRLIDHDQTTNVSADKYAEYKAGYNNVKIAYKNMLKPGKVQSKSDGFVNVGFGAGYKGSGMPDGAFGPEVGLAEYCSYRYGDSTTYIIKFAGGSPSYMRTQWNASGGAYYTAMAEFFDSSLALLSDGGVDFEITAFCFMQGESDGRAYSDGYAELLTAFADSVRLRYAEYAPSCGTAFIDVGAPMYYIGHDKINEIKREFAESDNRNYYLDVVAAGVDTERDNMDRLHFDAISQIKLGNLLGYYVTRSLGHAFDGCGRIEPTSFIGSDPYTDGYELSAIADGMVARSFWKFDAGSDKLNVCVSVSDGFVTPEDGVRLQLRDGTVYSVYADGRCVAEKSGENALSAKVSYFGGENGTCGYMLEFELPGEYGAFDFSLVNRNDSTAVRHYAALGAVDGKPETYMSVKDDKLVAGPYAKCGVTLGNAGVYRATDGWNLKNDDGSDTACAFMTANVPHNQLYFSGLYDNRFYAEAEFSADRVCNNDMFPKFGFEVITGNGTGIFYYVDAYMFAGVPTGIYLGYVNIKNGNFAGNYTVLPATVGMSSSAYLTGNYVKLGVLRDGDSITLYCNGNVVAELKNNVCRLGLTKSYVAVASFNTMFRIRNYFAETIDLF